MTEGQLQVALVGARKYWTDRGASTPLLAQVRVVLADLPGDLLARIDLDTENPATPASAEVPASAEIPASPAVRGRDLR
ncbi:MAG: hypothetical protein IPL43_02575 [Micropruina sp.]|nr:hypothetical protein [Micropruina sp.]